MVGFIYKIVVYLNLVIFTTGALAAGKLHDPTKPPSTNQTTFASQNIKIDAIIFCPDKKCTGRKTVVIDGQYLGIGDKVLGTQIVDIQKDSVRFKDENTEFTVALPDAKIKLKSAASTKNTGTSK